MVSVHCNTSQRRQRLKQRDECSITDRVFHLTSKYIPLETPPFIAPCIPQTLAAGIESLRYNRSCEFNPPLSPHYSRGVLTPGRHYDVLFDRYPRPALQLSQASRGPGAGRDRSPHRRLPSPAAAAAPAFSGRQRKPREPAPCRACARGKRLPRLGQGQRGNLRGGSHRNRCLSKRSR